jgi:hypothetical protein
MGAIPAALELPNVFLQLVDLSAQAGQFVLDSGFDEIAFLTWRRYRLDIFLK